jgi:DNA-binding NtrC family response regulator
VPAAGKPDGSPAEPYRVLVVEDDPTQLAFIQGVLSAAKLAVSAFQGVTEAMEAVHAAKEPFHVVCADFWMPQMDGLDLLLRVHQMEQDTSGVLITAADADAIEVERRKAAGVICVIGKPFRPDELIALVTRLARLTELQRKARRLADAALALRSVPPSSRQP